MISRRLKKDKIRKLKKTHNTKKIVIKIKKDDFKMKEQRGLLFLIGIASLLFLLLIFILLSSGFFVLPLFLPVLFILSLGFLFHRKRSKAEKEHDKKKILRDIPWGIKIKNSDVSLIIIGYWWKSVDCIIGIISLSSLPFFIFWLHLLIKDIDLISSIFIYMIIFCILLLVAVLTALWKSFQLIFNKTIVTANKTGISSQIKFFKFNINSVYYKRHEFKGFTFKVYTIRKDLKNYYELYVVKREKKYLATFKSKKQLIYIISKLDEYYGLDSLSDFDFDNFERNFVYNRY